MSEYQALIKEICVELGINFKLLSKDYIINLENNGINKYIYGYKFPLNNQGVGLILDDKYATYEVLSDLNYNIVDVVPLFKNYDKRIVSEYLDKYENIIIKPNNGTCGEDVYKISNYSEAIKTIDFLLFKHSPVCLSPYYEAIHEYRVIVLNKKVKIMYGKNRPIIIGDGRNNIRNLLLKFNYNYYNNLNNMIDIPYDLNRVLNNNEVFEIDFKFNLSRGSNLFEIKDNELKNKLEEKALSISKDLNIKFASIDIIETSNNELYILECNSGVMMINFMKLYKGGRNIAKSIYKEAIKLMFNIRGVNEKISK